MSGLRAEGGERDIFTVIAAWFIEHPLPAKKMYMSIVMANDAVYMLRVDPISRTLHPLES